MDLNIISEKFKWFCESKYGVFIHWGPYSEFGRGEQVLFREHMDFDEYEKVAKHWNPEKFDAEDWAKFFVESGFKYACLTARHHDGYCMWNTKTTDYSSYEQAPGRDFVLEYVTAMRKYGIKVGLYYSWGDWRKPAFYEGPENNPTGFDEMKMYMRSQIEELMTKYGTIDYLFFDGTWPRNAAELDSEEIIKWIREVQPGILINNRLGGGTDEGDFATQEQNVIPADRVWESCQTASWRWWGYTENERYKTPAEILKLLCECVSKGGNLILNVGPKPDGTLPEEFIKIGNETGRWLNKYGESIYKTDGGDLTESLTYGFQTIKDNILYLIFAIWSGNNMMRLPDIITKVKKVTLLETGENLQFDQDEEAIRIFGIPKQTEENLFPVMKIEFEERPQATQWGNQRLWQGDASRVAEWARRYQK